MNLMAGVTTDVSWGLDYIPLNTLCYIEVFCYLPVKPILRGNYIIITYFTTSIFNYIALPNLQYHVEPNTA